jgi:hypothetical protein
LQDPFGRFNVIWGYAIPFGEFYAWGIPVEVIRPGISGDIGKVRLQRHSMFHNCG